MEVSICTYYWLYIYRAGQKRRFLKLDPCFYFRNVEIVRSELVNQFCTSYVLIVPSPRVTSETLSGLDGEDTKNDLA
jgi:hypothetical protein